MNIKSASFILILLFAFSVNIYQVKSQDQLDVTVQTDKESYLIRELVNVTGNVTYQGELVENGLIGLQVENPDRTILLRTLPLNPNQSLPFTLQTTSLLPVDEVGTYKPSIERNKYMWFSMKVANTGFTSKTVYVSISILDSGFIPLDLDMASFTIPPGGTGTFMPRMHIPNWATIGTAYIFANVYSNWPILHGRPLCPESASFFSIIESTYYDEPPNGTLPSLPSQNGTYEMNFRMPPDMTPDNYRVKAAAWSPWAFDSTGFSSKTFDGIYAPSPPWPSFTVKPPSAGPNYTMTFDASSSSPEGYNDTIIKYSWTFGDGESTTGKIVTHSYTTVGNYTVTLNVTDLEGFWNTTSREVAIVVIHDIAVINIECLDEIYNNWTVSVKVTIENEGTLSETFSVTVYANSSIIETKQVTDLGPYETKILTFTWDTTGLTLLSNYSLEANATIVEDEIDTTDNSLTYEPIFVKMLGDIVFNRKIDLYDAVNLLSRYGVKEGEPNWDVMVDLVPDGKIDLYDAVKLLIQYGNTY